MTEKKEKGVGPLGLGDPYEMSLSHNERELYIPRLISKKAVQQCKEVDDTRKIADYETFDVAGRSRCMAKYGLLGYMVCRSLRMELDKCLIKWMHDPELVQHCTDLYLYGRSRYRTEGEDANIVEEIAARDAEYQAKRKR